MNKIFMLLAAVLLSSATAFAQSGKAAPLKGDVNEDGKVDFADVAAILQIMKDGGGTSEETIYYWYVGQTIPSSLPTDDSQLATGNNPGWRKIGTTKPSAGTVLWDEFEDSTLILGDTFAISYFACNLDINIGIYDSVGNEADIYFTNDSPTISNGMKIYTTRLTHRTFDANVKVKYKINDSTLAK